MYQDDPHTVVDSCVDYLTPREALQQLGTEWGRERYPRTWIDLCLRRAAQFAERRVAETPAATWVVHKAPVIVVSDVRYASEAAAIRASGGTVLQTTRVSASTIRKDHAQHSSEMEQERLRGDIVVDNTGTLEDLYDFLREKLL